MREGWTYKKLGECFPYIKNGANIKQIKGAKGYPITRIETLSGGVFNRDRMGYADIFDINKFQDYILRNGDLLMSHINSKAYIGRTVQYTSQNDEVIIHGMNLLRLRSNEGVILSSFFKFYTDSWHFKTDIASIRKDAVNQSSFAISDLKNFKVPIPSLSEQQSIVAELDKINELISLKKAQLSDLDSLAQSIFYDMFGDLMVNDKGWEIKKLGEIAQIGDGLHGTPRYDNTGDCYFINGNNLGNGSIVITKDTKKVNEQEKEKYKIEFTNNTLLVSINGSIGKVAFYNNENIILGKSACYIILNEYINKVYIFNVLKNRYFLDYVSNEYTGTTIRNISLKSMRNLPIPLPPLTLQQEFAKRIELIEQQKAQISSTIKDLETLLASRMQYWFD